MNVIEKSFWLDAFTLRRTLALICIAGVVVLVGAPATAASFNCKKAKSDIEKMICADRELNELDVALANVFSKASASSGELDGGATAELDWLKAVRDKCVSVDCLKSAYRLRIKQLAHNFVSFDCVTAKTRVELWICGDGNLQNDDMQLAHAYRLLKGALIRPEKLIAEQNHWLDKVRDRCDDPNCVHSTIDQRTQALRQQWSDLIDGTSKKIGYAKHAFHSDMMTWPNDASRTVVMLATQESATRDPDIGPVPNEDFEVDLYVIDSTSQRVLQHGIDSITSDAVELSQLALDRLDHAARLNAPVFGITTSHYHNGCAALSKHSLHLYAASSNSVKKILPEIATNVSTGMCQTECESSFSRRDLQFSGPAGQRYPDLLIHETHKETELDPKGTKNACKTTFSRKEYKLHFDGTQYTAPQGLDY